MEYDLPNIAYFLKMYLKFFNIMYKESNNHNDSKIYIYFFINNKNIQNKWTNISEAPT